MIRNVTRQYFVIGNDTAGPIDRPTVAQLIQLSLEENGMTQKELAKRIGVSPSRINDYVCGRAEPSLKVARMLCSVLGIAPALLLGM